MNRLEQIKEASKANIEKKDDEILHVYDRHAGFIDGAIWADNTMIEKACEWLKANAYSSPDGSRVTFYQRLNDFLSDFKKAMKGGGNEK